MALVSKDLRGLKCPVPVLRLNQLVVKKEVKPGDVVEVTADCPTFEADLKKWCTMMKKVLIKLRTEGTAQIAQVQI